MQIYGSVAQRRGQETVNLPRWIHRRFESFPAHQFVTHVATCATTDFGTCAVCKFSGPGASAGYQMHKHAPVAQMVEQRPEEPRVGVSNAPGGTNMASWSKRSRYRTFTPEVAGSIPADVTNVLGSRITGSFLFYTKAMSNNCRKANII